MKNRVKVTGIGVLASCGIGVEAFWNGILAGKGTARYLTHLEEWGIKDVIGCAVDGFDPQEWIRPDIRVKRFPRHSQFALACVEMALRECKISDDEWAQAGVVPVMTGTTMNDMDHSLKSIHRVKDMGLKGALPFNTFTYTPISISESIARLIPAKTRIGAIQNACCSGGDAICQAANKIANGHARIAIAGGTEAALMLHPMAEFIAARLTIPQYDSPTEAGKPFDVFRDVGVIGEGAAYVILEAEDSPRPAYAYLRGYSTGKDSGEFPGDGLPWVIEEALANARTRPEEIDYLSSWGPGHIILDQTESEAIEQVFGEKAHQIPAGSIKGVIGHPLGASSAIQFVSTVLSLYTGTIPPTANLEHQDPDCSLVLSSKARLLRPKTAIMNAHGIGNNNSAIVLGVT